MDDLVQWLRAQLNEDERIAKAATPGPWWVDSSIHTESINAGDGTSVIGGARWGDEASVFESDEDAAHIAAHDPARVLREIDAKRGIVDRYEFACREAAQPGIAEEERETRIQAAAAFQSSVCLLAVPYDGRPGYLESWRP